MVTVGPKVMADMSPIDSYPVRFVYNVVQIILCSYMCVEAFMIAYRNGYPVVPCAPFDAENPPAANLLWLFYVSKVLDFMDTIFIVLKKSWRQLSFLHVYHHCTIFLVNRFPRLSSRLSVCPNLAVAVVGGLECWLLPQLIVLTHSLP
ncbi:unnamed protein product [Ectocarpus sp. 8 AP-2014]